MRKYNGLTLAPILVVDPNSFFSFDFAHEAGSCTNQSS